MSELSAKHLSFVAEYLKDGSASAAAARAGYSPRHASRLLADPLVAAEIARRRDEVASESKITLASLLDEAEEGRKVAEAAENAGAMIGATRLKAQLLGLLADEPREAAGTDPAVQAAEFKTAGRLLADAAVSMGLPAGATPAQIVGAIAENPIATPEAFALLRANVVHGGGS